ncbi:MAG: ABC transporter ATP-binding protein, partial [Clostridia bacterium]|nr:ABC transporter ATP-binding protein [Clostridia bacterium]
MNMIKMLSKSVREYKKNAVLSPIFIALEVVMDISIPFVMTRMLLPCVETGDVRGIVLNGALVLLMAVVALLFGVISGWHCSTAAVGFGKNLRKDMFYSVQNFSFKNIDKFSTSSIITRMTTDVNFVQQAFMMLIRVALRSPLMLIFGLVATFIIGGPIATVLVFVVPVLAVSLILIFKAAHKHFKVLFKKYDVMNNVVEENVRAVRVVKSNVREDHEIEKFNASSDAIFKTFTKAQRIVVLSGPAMQLCLYTAITLIGWFSANAIIDGNIFGLSVAMTKADLSGLITYAIQIMIALMMLSFVVIQIVIARASAERICELLEERSDIVSPENAVMEVSDGSIDFCHVDFSYNEDANRNTLSDIDLHIKSGETVGIIGATGAGKTTLVQLLPRLYDVSKGELKVGGVNVKNYDLNALRGAVAMVLQKNVLFSGTIRDNLKWGNENATDDELLSAAKIARADEFLDRIGSFDFMLEQGGTNLSGGQRQRLCIARAIVGSPKILILDDSTSAVDVKTDASVAAQGVEENILVSFTNGSETESMTIKSYKVEAEGKVVE